MATTTTQAGTAKTTATTPSLAPTTTTTPAKPTKTTTTTTTTTATTTTTTKTSTSTPTITSSSCADGTTSSQEYPSGTLGPFTDPTDINSSDGYNTYVNNDGFWASGSTDSQVLCVTTPSKWSDTVNFGPAGYGGVQGYPDVQQLYNPPPTTLTSQFNATDPPDSRGTWELAYDVWTNNYTNDVMVWEDTSTSRLANNGAVIDNPNVAIDGVSYTLMHYGTGAQPERMLVRKTTVTSGSEDITDDLNYLISIGDLPAGDGINQVDFGWEVCSTVGTQVFTLNDFTMTSTP